MTKDEIIALAQGIASQPSASFDEELAQLRELEDKARKELHQLKIAECKLSFAAFVDEFFEEVGGRPLIHNRATREMVQALQNVADGIAPRLLIAVPPGLAKSTMLALYVAWRFAVNPAWQMIHMSHAHDLASIQSLRVRRLILGDHYQSMFPIEFRDDESTIGRWATSKGGHFMAIGLDSSITGKRAKEMILDDPLNAPDRFSAVARERVWQWFLDNAGSRLDGAVPPVVVVQQRLDRDDLIGKILAADPRGWKLLELPAEYPDGTLLAPEILPREKLDALREASLSIYNCQYLQQPSDDQNAIIKRSMWKFHRTPDVPEIMPRPQGCNSDPAVMTPAKFDRIVISADMTFGGVKTSNDYCVIQVWGGKGGERYLLEQWRAKATQIVQRDAIKDAASRYPHSKVLIEKAAGGAGAEEILTMDGIPNIMLVPATKDKGTRIGLVSPTIEGGHAYLPLGAPWLSDFVEELAGATKHDDQMDACSQALTDLNTHNTMRHVVAATNLAALAKRFGR